MISENEARRRRQILKNALRYLNKRVEDKATFKRSEMFGPEAMQGALVQWSRDIAKRLCQKQKMRIVATTRFASIYHAVEAVEISEEEVSTFLRPADEEAQPTDQSTDQAPTHDDDGSPVETSMSDQEPDLPPTLNEMVRSIISILPDLIVAVNRIEKKVVAIDATTKKTLTDMADILGIVYPEKQS